MHQLDLDFSDEKLESMAAAVKKVFENYPHGHCFHGWELHADVSEIYPKAEKMYVDTVQRAMRKFYRFKYRTVDHRKSLYQKV